MTEPRTAATARSAVKGARRIAIITIIGSLAVAAMIGISIILLPGEFSELQGKVLFTTLALAGFSITSLCHLAVVGRALQVVGYIGIAASAGAFLAATVLIWSDWSSDFDSSAWWKALGVFTVLAISLAHANLLLLLGARKRQAIRIGLFVTLATIALVALMLILPILTDGDIPGDNGDGYWRVLAVLAILDVLGTIVLPVASIFLRDDAGVAGLPATVSLALPDELAGRLAQAADASGSTREAVAIAALEAHLPARSTTP